MFRHLVVVAGLVAYTTAQSISQQCANAVTTIAADPSASQCLAIGALLPVVTAGSNTSIIQPLNTWLGDICAAPACTNATLTAVIANLTTGCSTELSSAGLSSDSLSSLTSTIESLYPTFRKTLCLKDTSTSTLCITETLTNYQTVTGILSLANIANIIQNPPTSLPANVTCTDCNKETYNIWAQEEPSIVSSAQPVFESQCGASFVDGSAPADVSEIASTAVASGSSSKSPAISLFETLTGSVTIAVGASSFIFLSTVYTMLI